MLAVGGVKEENLADFLRAGVSGFGIGSNIVNKKMIAEGNFEGITALAREFVDALARAESEV
jgi:2-dehydro-3-deoxyphosphogluconate aldolase/(4S)-4-hydroxy-2-oxoglutarate aldolase